MEDSLQKVALITGASSGIGRGAARYFIKQGYRVILVSRRVNRMLCLQEQYGSENVIVIGCDIRDSDMLLNKVNAVLSEIGRIDVLVNSAGYVKSGTSDLSRDQFLQMIETNLIALFDVTQAVIPYMKQQQSGRIINISSYNGVVAKPGLGGYAASKFGLMGLNEALYKELAPEGIYVTAICPNLVDTEMTQDVTSINRDELVELDDVIKTIDYLMCLSNTVMIKEITLQCRARLLQQVI